MYMVLPLPLIIIKYKNKIKLVIEQLANLLKNFNKTVGIFTQQKKWPLQENGMAAFSKNRA